MGTVGLVYRHDDLIDLSHSFVAVGSLEELGCSLEQINDSDLRELLACADSLLLLERKGGGEGGGGGGGGGGGEGEEGRVGI